MPSAVITAVGKAWALTKIAGSDTTTHAKYLGWGGGNTAADDGDTDLEDALPEARVAGTESTPDSTTYRVAGQITASAPRDVFEFCMFTGAGSGSPPSGAIAVLRAVIDEANLLAGDKVNLEGNIVVS